MKVEFHDLDLIRSKDEPDATNVEIAPIRPRRIQTCADMETAVKGMVAAAYNSANARTKPRRDSSYRYVAGSPGYMPRRFLNKAAYASTEAAVPCVVTSTPGSISPSNDPAHRPTTVHGAGSSEKTDNRAAHTRVLQSAQSAGSVGGGADTRLGTRASTRGSSRSGGDAASRGADWKCVFLTGYTSNTATRLMATAPTRNTNFSNSSNDNDGSSVHHLRGGDPSARDERLSRYGLPPGWPRPKGAWIDGPQYGGRFSQPFLSTQSFAVGPNPKSNVVRDPSIRSALRPSRRRGRKGPPPIVAAAEFELNRYQVAHLQKYAFTCSVRSTSSVSPQSLRSAVEGSFQGSYLDRCIPSAPQTCNNTYFVRQAYTLPKQRLPEGPCSPMHHLPRPLDTLPFRPNVLRGYAESSTSKTLSYDWPAPAARENSGRPKKPPTTEAKSFPTSSDQAAGAGDTVLSSVGSNMDVHLPDANANFTSSTEQPNNRNPSERTAAGFANDVELLSDATLGTGVVSAAGDDILSYDVNRAIWVAEVSTNEQN